MGLSKNDVPEDVEAAIVLAHGGTEGGNQWLTHAIDKVNTLEDDWDIVPVEVLGGETSFLVRVEDPEKDAEAVIKVPTNPQTGCDEIAALKIWEDCNVPLVQAEDQSGAFMMDYVAPTLREVNPFQAFVLADLMHTPTGNFDYNFPLLLTTIVKKLATAHKIQGTDIGPSSEDLGLAVKILETLLATQDHQELLHGDYRNHNIIYAEDGPVIIDPKPCIGDSLFDIASWLADTDDVDGVAVVGELIGGSVERLIPWVWALAVIRERNLKSSTPKIAELLRPQAQYWLDKQPAS